MVSMIYYRHMTVGMRKEVVRKWWRFFCKAFDNKSLVWSDICGTDANAMYCIWQ